MGSESPSCSPVAPVHLLVVDDALAEQDTRRDYFIGECGHRVYLTGQAVHVGPCRECETEPAGGGPG